ncbi:MAG: DNA-directed RNA polymerase subunit beta [Candidatus Obscuribacter sp.]|nr:DNA-directed RNA polymerase subunit beta [Candidatus Melainabacteria bacterium]MDX1985457.1 DNA-directed RNA polymerase subunit beta [Candidatus Obscuribacter sp.]
MSFYFQAPDLAEFPRRSYRRFLEETLGNLFSEISPVGSEYAGRFEITFVAPDGKVHWRFEDYAPDSGYPTSPEMARKTNMTHARRLLMDVYLRDNQTGELRKSTAYMTDVPVITDRGTFVINGSERVVLGQLVRAPGIYFSSSGPTSYKALMLAEMGAPIAFELELDPNMGKTSRAKCRIKLPKRSWIAATTVLLAMGVDAQDIQRRLGSLLERNRIDFKKLSQSEALAVVGRGWKPDGGGGAGSGATALKELTDKRRYSLGKLGRRRLNAKLGLEGEGHQLTATDLMAAIEYILGLPLDMGHMDNIDSLENRHLRGVGETMTRAVRPALGQMTRSIRTRLELNEDEEIASPNDLLDTRPFANAISKYFTGNPLVQYLDQQNPLSELSHRRRITSFGPGGIDPAAAPVEMRDVHPSQIGRVCLVESPEGKNCGMVSYMATYCRIDDDGFMTVPYRRVENGIITDEVKFLGPGDDKRHTLAPPDTKVEGNKILGPMVAARRGENFMEVTPEEVDMIGIAPQGFISVGSGLIPFLEHDDANRALMGGGMMRQTLPLIRPERPRVGTGMERIVARSSGHSVIARRAGTVTKVTANEIVITQASGEARSYSLIRYDRTNQNTILDQRPSVKVGQQVEAGQIIADGPAIDNGELSLGRNLLIAFLSWNGYNFEDAIVVREGLVKDHKLSHIEIEKHSIGVHQTLRGPEILTPELPNVAGKDLEHLDDRGIAKIGSYVNPGDILVSKLSPKEAKALSAEEELLQAIFGKVAEEMGDTSLRVPHGSGGRVIDVRIFTPETTPELKAGIICEIEVLIARLCPLEVGDKLAGRHGNKGIVAIVVKDCDMPYLPDGTPVDLVLNPLGVPSRMNVGQVFDTQLGLYASILNRYYRIHQFDESIAPDASFRLVTDALKEVRKLPNYQWMGEDGKVKLYDGRTGEAFDRPVLVGRQYMLKLNQLVLHKINARSGLGGPYAAVTQQPVGGKANHGGQRMGEMEVWAIQAYGAANVLHEMMTIKADDIQGRHQSYADMVQGNEIQPGGRTAAFDGLCCEIRGLGMEVTLGKVVDTFEPMPLKGVAEEGESAKEKKDDGTPTKTLEEHYQVSRVDKLEAGDGTKILEIPAGDYVPVTKPPAPPVITSITSGKHGGKPRIEMSQEPLFDDIDESQVPKAEEKPASTPSFVDAFISEITLGGDDDEMDMPDDIPKDFDTAVQKKAQPQSPPVTPPPNGDHGKANLPELPELLAREIGNSLVRPGGISGFPAFSELTVLARELAAITGKRQNESQSQAAQAELKTEPLIESELPPSGYFKQPAEGRRIIEKEAVHLPTEENKQPSDENSS